MMKIKNVKRAKNAKAVFSVVAIIVIDACSDMNSTTAIVKALCVW